MSGGNPVSFLSWGGGLQSTALLVMSALGLCEKVDIALFADTEDEPQWVYDTLTFYGRWAATHGMETGLTRKGSLSKAIQRGAELGLRFASIPAWTMGEDGRASLLRRQCTREYKIEPIWKAVRQRAGLKPRQRAPKGFRCLLGISTDEADRMSDSRIPAVTNVYPLIEARMSRADCHNFLGNLKLPIPRKSSCVFCPYHSDSYWRELKEQYPVEFQRAVDMDVTIRNMSKRGINGDLFLHRSLQPLVQIDFHQQGEMFSNECAGHCGV